MPTRILVIDDDAAARQEVAECLADEGYQILEADSVEPALEIVRNDPEVSIALTDIQMPGKSGLEFAAEIRSELQGDRDFELIIMTGHGGSQEAITALRLGALDFIEKPIDPERLIHVVQRAEELVNLKRARRHYEQGMEADILAKTSEIRGLLRNVETAYRDALEILATASEYKDPETGQHIRRIGAYARLMAAELGWTKNRQDIIEIAAELHDAGKIGIPDAVLLKPGKLSGDEIGTMKGHAEIGHKILSRSHHPTTQFAANIAWAHHERWDGGGYPRGLKENEIPLEARITAFGDIYDALRSQRPYKPAFDHETALRIMLEGDGRTDPSHFDPKLLEIFRRKAAAFAEIFRSLAE